ncbi:peptidoglycan-binding domain-containing protein [Streptomyces sp. NPDC051976]|uniref:peptidoglycan-binding domain-containing protein n=1 Tax=Streptomyces sp. NPDC051976 TaxID=3154947 RepID=UPI00342D3626
MAPQQPERPAEPPHEDGEIRAAERAARRAAAVAAAEEFHPLRLRPYVAEPGGEAAQTTVRPLLVRDGDEVDGPATADLGLFPSLYSGLEYPQEEPPLYEDVVYAADAEYAAVRGRHRRRRRGLVVTAAAVAASALAAGAVAVTGQVMGGESGTDHALPPDQGTSMPDVQLPTDAARATTAAAHPVTHRAAPPTTAAPTHSATTSPSPSPTASPSGSPSPATTATGTVTPAPPGTPTPGAPSHTADPATSPTQLLQQGDVGPAVSELQRRLTEAWCYHGDIDGDFDQHVAHAVATFQMWYAVTGDPPGVYGPNTRTALERATA